MDIFSNIRLFFANIGIFFSNIWLLFSKMGNVTHGGMIKGAIIGLIASVILIILCRKIGLFRRKSILRRATVGLYHLYIPLVFVAAGAALFACFALQDTINALYDPHRAHVTQMALQASDAARDWLIEYETANSFSLEDGALGKTVASTRQALQARLEGVKSASKPMLAVLRERMESIANTDFVDSARSTIRDRAERMENAVDTRFVASARSAIRDRMERMEQAVDAELGTPIREALRDRMERMENTVDEAKDAASIAMSALPEVWEREVRQPLREGAAADLLAWIINWPFNATLFQLQIVFFLMMLPLLLETATAILFGQCRRRRPA